MTHSYKNEVYLEDFKLNWSIIKIFAFIHNFIDSEIETLTAFL